MHGCFRQVVGTIRVLLGRSMASRWPGQFKAFSRQLTFWRELKRAGNSVLVYEGLHAANKSRSCLQGCGEMQHVADTRGHQCNIVPSRGMAALVVFKIKVPKLSKKFVRPSFRESKASRCQASPRQHNFVPPLHGNATASQATVHFVRQG